MESYLCGGKHNPQKSADSVYLSKSFPQQPNRRVGTSMFENPTSAPFAAAAPVDTITPLPLLYHVRIFYLVPYASPTTHPSQPTYTFNELQDRKRTRNEGENNKKKKGKRKRRYTHKTQNKTKHNNKKIIIIQNDTIPKSTTNIQIHHFKTTVHILNTLPTYKYITSKQHSCVQGPLLECRSVRPGASGLSYHCTQASHYLYGS